MKDIDFDELDRAVNSLMSGAPKAEPAKEEDVSTLTLQSNPEAVMNTARPSESVPSENSLVDSDPRTEPIEHLVPSVSPLPTEEVPKPVTATGPAVSVPPAIRRRGRFMDMVRPTSQESNRPVASRPISRQGSTISPSSQFSQPDAQLSQSPTPFIAEQPSERPAGEASGEWPDPLQAIDFDKTTAALESKAYVAETRVSQADYQQPQPWSQEPATTASPFLPDTKVEKRPLGRPVDSDDSVPASPEPGYAPVVNGNVLPQDDMAESNGLDAGDTAVPEQPIPVELRKDVLAIEADTGAVAEEEAGSDMSGLKPALVEQRASPSALGSPRPAMTSIPQQYKVQPKSADTTPGAIYDTATYHQPLAHPAKKQPGWLWVVSIILILLLGAASGAAVYFFGLV